MNICLIYWPAENAQIIDMVAGLPKGLEAWWRVIRVSHQLHAGGNELDTCFFKPTNRQENYESLGNATFRIKDTTQ